MKKTKKEEEKEEDSTDDKGKRNFYHGEACSSTKRAVLREEMRGVRELALRRVER